MILEEKLRMQKRKFPNTHLTLISFVFSLWITNATANEFEKGGQKGVDTYLSRLKWV